MFDQITLPNGLRVVGEKLGHIHSCTVGVWVKVGSVNELPDRAHGIQRHEEPYSQADRRRNGHGGRTAECLYQ